MEKCSGCGAVSEADLRACPSCGRISSSAEMPTLELDNAATSAEHQGSPPQSGAFAPGTVLCKRYRIVSLLGRGGMGEVYRAEDLKLGTAIALKFLTHSMSNNSEALAQLHREVRNARRVAHPGVCRVYDIGEVGSQSFLTMEYIDGEDFASLLRRIGRLPADKALEAAHQLCAGLAAAHDAGLLHRDLKPGNVMLDARGRVRITDFGLALEARSADDRREVAGTPAYMAPEQIASGETSVASDIYSLGLVLYELFTGRSPYELSTRDTWRRVHLESPPRSPSSVVKDIDPFVESTILRCLQKDPAWRPASVQEVEAGLPKGATQSEFEVARTPVQTPLLASPVDTQTIAPAARQRWPQKLWARIAGAVTLVALLAFACFLWITKREPPPFAHFTIERATDSDKVRSTALSPDGRYLASVVRDATGEQSLWVHDFPTRSDRSILRDPKVKYEDLIFSPDGNYIYFRVHSPGADDTYQADLYRIPVLGGPPSMVIRDVYAPISFIGKGERICLYRQNAAAGSYQFINASSDGGDEHVLATVKASLIFEPACSPDARHAVISQAGTSSLQTLDFATGATQVIRSGNSGQYIYDLRWDPRGRGIFAVTESDSRSGQLSFLPNPGKVLREITNDLNTYSGISMTADAKTLATTQVDYNIRFYEVPLAAPSNMREHNLPAMEWFAWLDNHRIVGSGKGTDIPLRVADLLQDDVRSLNVDKSHVFLYPSLCDKDTVIAMGNTPDGKDSGLFKIPLSGSAAIRLTHRGRQMLPVCSGDGKWLFYADTIGYSQFITRVPFYEGRLDEAAAKKAADGFSWFDLSPDSTMLAVAAATGPDRIVVLSTTSLEAISTFPPVAGKLGVIAFASDNKSLYYQADTEAGSAIWRQPLKGAAEKLMDLPGKHLWYIRASPDNTKLGVLIGETRAHAIVLREEH